MSDSWINVAGLPPGGREVRRPIAFRNDYYTRFQTVINELGASAQTLYFPPGIYPLYGQMGGASTLDFPASWTLFFDPGALMTFRPPPPPVPDMEPEMGPEIKLDDTEVRVRVHGCVEAGAYPIFRTHELQTVSLRGRPDASTEDELLTFVGTIRRVGRVDSLGTTPTLLPEWFRSAEPVTAPGIEFPKIDGVGAFYQGGLSLTPDTVALAECLTCARPGSVIDCRGLDLTVGSINLVNRDINTSQTDLLSTDGVTILGYGATFASAPIVHLARGPLPAQRNAEAEWAALYTVVNRLTVAFHDHRTALVPREGQPGTRDLVTVHGEQTARREGGGYVANVSNEDIPDIEKYAVSPAVLKRNAVALATALNQHAAVVHRGLQAPIAPATIDNYSAISTPTLEESKRFLDVLKVAFEEHLDSPTLHSGAWGPGDSYTVFGYQPRAQRPVIGTLGYTRRHPLRVTLQGLHIRGHRASVRPTYYQNFLREQSSLVKAGSDGAPADGTPRYAATLVVEDVFLEESVGDGIHVVGNATVDATNVRIRNCWRSGLAVTSGSSELRVDNAWLSDPEGSDRTGFDLEVDGTGNALPGVGQGLDGNYTTHVRLQNTRIDESLFDVETIGGTAGTNRLKGWAGVGDGDRLFGPASTLVCRNLQAAGVQRIEIPHTRARFENCRFLVGHLKLLSQSPAQIEWTSDLVAVACAWVHDPTQKRAITRGRGEGTRWLLQIATVITGTAQFLGCRFLVAPATEATRDLHGLLVAGSGHTQLSGCDVFRLVARHGFIDELSTAAEAAAIKGPAHLDSCSFGGIYGLTLGIRGAVEVVDCDFRRVEVALRATHTWGFIRDPILHAGVTVTARQAHPAYAVPGVGHRVVMGEGPPSLRGLSGDVHRLMAVPRAGVYEWLAQPDGRWLPLRILQGDIQ